MVDFLLCLFLGPFGVHKFREGKIGMGILYFFTGGLLGIGWLYDCVKYLIKMLNTPTLHSLSSSDPLPVVRNSNVMLASGEVCHYSRPATAYKTKNVVVGHTGVSSGMSIRVAKGMSYRIGESKSTSIRGNVSEKTEGRLTITNKRVVFSASKGAFDKRLQELTSITPYKDGIAFQFGSQQYTLLTPDTSYIYQVVSRVVNNHE